ncbi:MAG: hypothetical protein GYB65_13475, partial [Chloroflexi bacterium]|nr:hypothetical protein [Chloroflexota bacterium]
RDVIASFEPLSDDNRRILLMEWVTEGMTLVFLGVLVTAVTALQGPENDTALIVYLVSALMLGAMAVLSLFTGARTSQLPFKLCPPIFGTAAVLFVLGGLL